MVEDKNYELGSRIECDGSLGTLRYVGPVGDTKGEWLGIDWDDPSRGKHNGTYEGVKYFTTWHPTSGSFIRHGKANFGISCPDAIKSRYGLINDDLAGIDRENLTSLQKEINAPFLEMVGFSKVNKKQSKFDQLEIIWLRDQSVSNAGNPGELETLCPRLKELDISRNLTNSWKVISDICIQLRSLTRLNVSENKLPCDIEVEQFRKSFSNVTHLTMARMNYNWANVQRCIAMFPSIRELSISFNIVNTIERPPDCSNIMKLRALTLEGNLIENWNEILKLGSLPCLEYLNVNENRIKVVSFPTDKSMTKTSLFANLRQLHISKNDISEWRSISELDKLLSLEDLKFRDNPILKCGTPETTRQLIIARISKLKFLNGTEVWQDERTGAEYDYLKLFGKQWLDTESIPEKRVEFITEHPQYPSLIKKYGLPDVHVSKLNAGMGSNVISVEFICPDDPNQPQRVRRKLLKDMEVQKVVGIVQRLFKTSGKIPTLSFVQQTLSSNEIKLDKPLQNLSYFSIQDGDQILVRW
ncbi:tubulin-specific chaperone E [Neodiprion virginianus]|uniref:tubulin-specific chaperone E n=1 Tax=Neodiprion virginianus TaxID=2961670 RepID=UPI001EE6DAF9|nr:tubulin-specific chaperone E [Neodiprion virginianus]XP_046627614.1 tubulin-specific chaperone E [Neodiprion virginianus]